MIEQNEQYKEVGRMAKSKALMICVQKFKKNGIGYINVREFLGFGDSAIPSYKGFVVRADLIDALIAILQKAKE